jgi:hypothetical protein
MGVMNDALLAEIANLDRAKLLTRLAELDRQRRIIVALIRSKAYTSAKRKAVRRA